MALIVTGVAGLLLGSCSGALASSGDGAGTAVPAPGATVTVKSVVTEKADAEPAPTVTETVIKEAAADPEPEPEAEPEAEPEESSDISPGTYVVGEDIKAGTYKAKADDEGIGLCYWSRLKKNNGIIDNDISEGRSVVTIKESDYAFETSGCSNWEKQ